MSAAAPVVLRWRIPDRRLTTRWRGPSRMAQALERRPNAAIAGLVGPPGPRGPPGEALRLDASLAATWTLSHPLGRVPSVQVFLTGGEAVLADITASDTQITVTFPFPQQGFVLLV